MNPPLAYLITFTCYGTWLHGDARGSADRTGTHAPGEPYLPADPNRETFERSELTEEPYLMDGPARQVVLDAIREVCRHRGWVLHAAHVRSNHLHAVVTGDARPERVMNDFKAYASRRLNEAGGEPPGRRRWTRHGSTRYLWTEAEVRAAVEYVVLRQGRSMAVYPGSAGGPQAAPESDRE
jgi:REP element-mobilizing transposase RayT